MIAWIVTAITCFAFAVALYARHRAREPRILDYDDTTIERRGIREVTRAFAEVNSNMVWGSGSVTTWQRRCEASLRASRRRRGLIVLPPIHHSNED